MSHRKAAVGGNLALVEEADSITIDADSGVLQLNVSEGELARRAENWRPALAALYHRSVGQVRPARQQRQFRGSH
jgi:dihydroxy-acid dehydratase